MKHKKEGQREIQMARWRKYRDRKSLEKKQHELQNKEIIEKNEKLVIKEARLRNALNNISRQACHQAEKGCAYCLQTQILMRASSFLKQPIYLSF